MANLVSGRHRRLKARFAVVVRIEIMILSRVLVELPDAELDESALNVRDGCLGKVQLDETAVLTIDSRLGLAGSQPRNCLEKTSHQKPSQSSRFSGFSRQTDPV